MGEGGKAGILAIPFTDNQPMARVWKCVRLCVCVCVPETANGYWLEWRIMLLLFIVQPQISITTNGIEHGMFCVLQLDAYDVYK